MFTVIVGVWQLVVLVVFCLVGRFGRVLLSGRVGFAECAVDYRDITCHANSRSLLALGHVSRERKTK